MGSLGWRAQVRPAPPGAPSARSTAVRSDGCGRRSAPATTAPAPRRRTSPGSRRFVVFHGKRHPDALGAADVAALPHPPGHRSARSRLHPEPGLQRAPVPLPRGARPRAAAARGRRRARSDRCGCPWSWLARGGERRPAPRPRHSLRLMAQPHVRRRPAAPRVLPPARQGRRLRPRRDHGPRRQGTARTASPCSPAGSPSRCARTSSACAGSTTPTSPAERGASPSPTPSARKYAERGPRVGAGSGSSPPRASTWTAPPASAAATTSTRPSSRGSSRRRPRRRPHQARHLPHPAPLLRHPPARERLRHPDHPGAPRPHRRDHHDDLHARPEPRRPRREEPARWHGLAPSPTLAAVIPYPSGPFPYQFPVYTSLQPQLRTLPVAYSVFGGHWRG